MTVKELKLILNRTERHDHCTVCVKTNNHSMGFISSSEIRGGNQGIDWDKDSFILWPSDDLIKVDKTNKK